MKIKTHLGYVIVFIWVITTANIMAQDWSDNGSGDLYYSGGKVGIGTSNPTGLVSVYHTGTIGTSGDFSQASFYSTNGTQELGIDPNQIFTSQELVLESASSHVSIKTNNVYRMRIDATGRVGIGNEAIDITGTALDQFVVGNGTSSQGIVVYHGTSNDAGYAFANSTGAVTGRILYINNGNYLSLQHGASGKMNIYQSLMHVIPNTRMDGRLFFGSYTNEGVGTIQIKKEGPNDGITLWTESGNVTKRMWIDDDSNTLQLTAGNQLNKGLSLDKDGNIGIGTSNQNNKLEVSGTIRSKEVIVETNG